MDPKSEPAVGGLENVGIDETYSDAIGRLEDLGMHTLRSISKLLDCTALHAHPGEEHYAASGREIAYEAVEYALTRAGFLAMQATMPASSLLYAAHLITSILKAAMPSDHGDGQQH